MREDDKCFCAVEFCKLENEEENVKVEENSVTPASQNQIENDSQIEFELLKRVKQADNYLITETNDEEIVKRKTVYDSFNDITKNLTIEDRWWFYELLDEIKSREPELPEALKIDFINLCKNGLVDISKGVEKPKLGLVKK